MKKFDAFPKEWEVATYYPYPDKSVEWRPIVCWEGLYSVSEDGRVYSHRSFLELSPSTNSGGYKMVLLSYYGEVHGALVHRCVMEAFYGPPHDPNHLVRHLDDIPDHNHYRNLMYGTHLDNARDRDNNHGMILDEGTVNRIKYQNKIFNNWVGDFQND